MYLFEDLNFFFSIYLECYQSTYLFNGRCFTSCPEQSYIVPEKVEAETNIESKALSLKKRSREGDDYETLEDIVDLKHNHRAVQVRVAQKLCDACHKSCLKCDGPSDSDCLACTSEFQHHVIDQRKKVCLPFEKESAFKIFKDEVSVCCICSGNLIIFF